MNLPQDSYMLLSVVNTYLRDRYPSLAAFCEAEEVDQEALVEKLGRVDFIYEPEFNQFR